MPDILSNTILYVGYVGEVGTAMSIHSRNISKIFQDLGYDIYYLCQYVDEEKRYENDRYFYTNQYLKIKKFKSVEWMIEEFLALKIYSSLKKKIEEIHPKIIIFYGYSGEKKIIKYCNKKGIKVFVDRTDWFESSDRKGIFGNLYTKFVTDKCIKNYDFNASGVISISKYFEDYYLKNNQNTLWIPPVFDIEVIDEFNKDPECINIVYAGSLGGGKDTIDNVIKYFLINENKEFNLNLLGIDENQLNNRFGFNDWEKYNINAFGRVSNEDVIKIVSKSDFSLLLRQNKRYAKAGFSTKFAESMSLGVPMICTKVGGADSLIENNKNGILINDNNFETITEVMNNIKKLSNQEILQMKKGAFLTAKKYFDYHNYLLKMNEFINR